MSQFSRWNDDRERSYVERAADEVRAWLGDDEAVRRRREDMRRNSRGEGRYKGTFDRADLHGFGYESAESGIRQPRTRHEWERMRGPYAGRGPQGDRRSDERIAEEINEQLTHHGMIDATQIQVRVQDGEVTHEGTVGSRAERRLAEAAAESCSGVREVFNHLRVNRNGQ
ncbi:MAG TPA: BON domain-containing protein [Blastocatellia bacterium]|nr:BON domain-containing protein [Blastocatellia bacterium]